MENHALHLKELGRRHGLGLSIEPYDLNPCRRPGAGRRGGRADVRVLVQGCGFNTEFSCFEAVSIAHTLGRPVVGAEAFTAGGDAWRLYPGTMKSQGDWAFCAGINRFVFHRYHHQPWLDRWPGMTMGPLRRALGADPDVVGHGRGFHRYLARCQAMLRRGLPVADILYLAPEGAPNVFRPPRVGHAGGLPDRRGYNFDGCTPGGADRTRHGRDGTDRVPRRHELPAAGAAAVRHDDAGLAAQDQVTGHGRRDAVVGPPPKKSPSLADYPQCDAEVQDIVSQLWSKGLREGLRRVRDGGVIYLPVPSPTGSTPEIYPDYEQTAALLSTLGVRPDFECDGPVRYTHRHVSDGDGIRKRSGDGSHDSDVEIYFLANTTSKPLVTNCRFRVAGQRPELWDPLTGLRRPLPQYRQERGVTVVPLQFAAGESYFIVFRWSSAERMSPAESNFPSQKPVLDIAGPWEVSFDPKWGGPAQTTFEKLDDWSKRPEEGIKYYSGKATYRNTFAFPSAAKSGTISVALGDVKNMAAIKLNGTDLGVVWCEPWRVELPPGLLKPTGNRLEITVANSGPTGSSATPRCRPRSGTPGPRGVPTRKTRRCSPPACSVRSSCCGPTSPASSRCKTSSSASRRRQSPSRRLRRSPRA